VKFVLIDALRCFLGTPYTHFLFIDADVYIHPDAPLPDFSAPGVHVHTDQWHAEHTLHWSAWCKDLLNLDIAPGAAYYNAGIWGCDRDAAERILEFAVPPHHEFFQDQHAFNAWVEKARQKGLAVNQLPVEWNRWGRDPGPAWFYHLWGNDKLEDLKRLKHAGYLP
jgi:hypothetical protein